MSDERVAISASSAEQALPDAEQALGQRVGVRARGACRRDLVGETPQVFDQHDAQRDRDRPQLADGQRLNALIGVDEAAQRLWVEVAVRVRHERPGQAEHARVAGEGPAGQLGQAPVVAGGQIVAHLAHMLLDQVVVVEQPFGGRHHAAAALQFFGARAIGLQQDRRVVVQSGVQRQDDRRRLRHGLRSGEALSVLLQPLDTEQLFTHRRGIGP